MRSWLIIGMLALAIAPGVAQTLPPISQLLPQVGVEAPPVEEITDSASKETTKRLSGAFGIRNNSRYDLKDLEVRCSYIAPSGTIIGNYTVTVYEIFKATTRQTSASLTLPAAPAQVKTANCAATGGIVVAVGAPQPDPCPDCPDAAERYRTCDCDLAELLEADSRNPRYLRPVRRARTGAR